MSGNPVDNLVKLGFSEYEAKAYVALLRKSPVTGYELSKLSGVPRSMIYEVLGKLTTRGAAMSLRSGSGIRYAPVPAADLLDQLHREHEELVGGLKDTLAQHASAPNLDYVWNIEGRDNIVGRAQEMIDQAKSKVYLSILPSTVPALRDALEKAAERGVRVVLYTEGNPDLPGAQVVSTPVSEEAASRVENLGIILVVDGEEVLISESLNGVQAQASWTSNALLVFIAEHHLRTDPYLPQVLDWLAERASDIIREEDRVLFARARESHIDE